jgi:hypothetical protein
MLLGIGCVQCGKILASNDVHNLLSGLTFENFH